LQLCQFTCSIIKLHVFIFVISVTVTAVTKIEKSLDMPSSFSILNQ